MSSYRKRVKPIPASGEERRPTGGRIHSRHDQCMDAFKRVHDLLSCLLLTGAYLQRNSHQPKKMPSHFDQDHLPP